MSDEMADPGQDLRGAPDIDPLWTILDLTPAGRGAYLVPEARVRTRPPIKIKEAQAPSREQITEDHYERVRLSLPRWPR